MDVWEWTAKAGEKLEVPAEHRQRMRYRFLVVLGGERGRVYGWCREFEFRPVGNHLVLQDVLVDTSNRVEGITLEQRITRHEQMTFWGAAAMLVPHKEKKEGGDGGKS